MIYYKLYQKKLKLIYFQPLRPGSLRASIFGLVCVTLGTGMLPLPYFFKSNGIKESLKHDSQEIIKKRNLNLLVKT